MNPSIFLSTFHNKIDKKGRISIPPSFRSVLAHKGLQSVVLFQSIHINAIEGMGMDRMEKISQSIDQLDLFSQAHNDWTSSVFANAHVLSFDSEGRITLPSDLCQAIGIDKEAAFVGQGPTFQIWSPDNLAIHQHQARQRIQNNNNSIGSIAGKHEGGA